MPLAKYLDITPSPGHRTGRSVFDFGLSSNAPDRVLRGCKAPVFKERKPKSIYHYSEKCQILTDYKFPVLY